MKEMRTQNKIAWRSSVPKTVNTYRSVGTKLCKIVRQCPQLIIGGLSSIHAACATVFVLTKPIPFMYSAPSHSIQFVAELSSSCLFMQCLTQSCDFSSKLEKRICGLYAIEWMGKSVWLYLRHPTILWTGEMEHLHALTYGYKGVLSTANKELYWIWCRLQAILATITVDK